MSSENRSDLWSWMMLLFLALIWGSSFILMKRSLIAFTPYQIGALRMILAGLALSPWVLVKVGKEVWKKITPTQWWVMVVVGAIGNGIPAFLFPLAETRINSASAGILNAMTPLFVWVIGISFFQLRASRKQLLGLGLGLIGATILVTTGKGELNLLDHITYSLLAILATVFYGISANLVQRYLTSLGPIFITGVALGSAAIPYSIFLLFSGFFERMQTHPEAWEGLFYVGLLSIVGTAMALVFFNRLLQKTHVIFATSVTYLIPIVALSWGVLDGETIVMWQLLGMAVIISGVYLINNKKGVKHNAQKEASSQSLANIEGE